MTNFSAVVAALVFVGAIFLGVPWLAATPAQIIRRGRGYLGPIAFPFAFAVWSLSLSLALAFSLPLPVFPLIHHHQHHVVHRIVEVVTFAIAP